MSGTEPSRSWDMTKSIGMNEQEKENHSFSVKPKKGCEWVLLLDSASEKKKNNGNNREEGTGFQRMPLGRKMEFVRRGNLLLGLGYLKRERNKLLFGLDTCWEEFNFG